MLKKLNIDAEILQAKNGFEAIEIYSNKLPDIVFMDVQMPEMNGFDATRKIRSLETNGRIPIIGITAGVLFGEKEKCLEAGMDEFIPKPIVKETILKTLEKWLVFNN
jgi:CheY-like chemotaxis protein